MSKEDITEEQALLREKLRKLASRIDEELYNRRKHLLGKVLTVVDSAIPDPEQRKATKDLMTEVFYSASNSVSGDHISWELRQLAESEGFELYDGTAQNELIQPANQYEEIKLN